MVIILVKKFGLAEIDKNDLSMTLIYILIFLIFLEFSLRNYFEFFKDIDNSNNIKKNSNLSLKRNYIVNSLSSENKKTELDEKIRWRLIKNSEISIKVTAPYINENLNYKYKINELGARSSNFTGKKNNRFFWLLNYLWSWFK